MRDETDYAAYSMYFAATDEIKDAFMPLYRIALDRRAIIIKAEVSLQRAVHTPALPRRKGRGFLKQDYVGACSERRRLLSIYKKAVEKLSEASKNLSNASISYELDAFSAAWARCQACWEECSRCRHDLQDHRFEHGC